MDAHMHFDLYEDRKELLDFIENQQSYTIAMTNLPAIYKSYLNKYDNYKYVKIAMGYHPELVLQYPNQLRMFMELIDTTRYIGEVGLDGYKDFDDQIKQYEIFQKIINICNGKNKILSVHSRNAIKQTLELLNHYDGTIILHWYSGPIKYIKAALDLNCYFSINQNMILSKSGRNIINHIPIDKLVLESDAPFTNGLSKCYSLEFNNIIYSYLSELYHINITKVMERIRKNFITLLRA